ncbi:hypothetical protein [Bartonella machadoae]|uniref:hypothetical protein n=1 Tax=Bartonella machadoae TaxID=2893471 RepID=UPI001F4D2EC4|nr:hypothetical protein [Bartonella machadoae]UNE53566.1 hypothetical protein LNM86_07805 [Bartonella machadoae]
MMNTILFIVLFIVSALTVAGAVGAATIIGKTREKIIALCSVLLFPTLASIVLSIVVFNYDLMEHDLQDKAGAFSVLLVVIN